jgi:hypothetical protein
MEMICGLVYFEYEILKSSLFNLLKLSGPKTLIFFLIAVNDTSQIRFKFFK